MRVIHVIASCTSGGIESLVLGMATDMVQRGHEVAIAYLAGSAALGYSTAFEAQYLKTMARHGIPAYELGHRVWRNPLLGGFRLGRVLRTFRPEIVHLHVARAATFYPLTAYRAHVVYTHHSDRFAFHAGFFRMFDMFVDEYVAVSEAGKAVLESVTNRRVNRIYNGIADDRVSFAGTRRIHGRARLISVGNLEPRKDYGMLLEVAACLAAEREGSGDPPDVMIVGQGYLRPELEERIHDCALGDVVHLLGARRDVDALLARAHVYLLTSISEGFPMSLIEAGRSGLPTVATDVGGVSEIIRDGDNGFVVPSNDVTAMVARLRLLLGDAELLARMSAQAHSRSLQFRISQTVTDHLVLYGAMLN